MQQCITGLTQNAVPFWEMYSEILSRAGAYRVGLSTDTKLRQTWRCKDGQISFLIFGGSTGAKSNRALVEWLDSEGMADDFLKQMDPAFDMGSSDKEFHERLTRPVEQFFLNHTKAELYEGALKRKIMLYPVSDIQDLLESPQLKARGFWEEIEHTELGPEGKPVLYPGAFAKASETPWKNRRRAPLIGEHNQEIYEEVNLSKEDLILLKQVNTI